MTTLEITPEQLAEMLAKHPGCATLLKKTEYRISMTYSKGEKPGPPFLCAVVSVSEMRDRNGDLIMPIRATFDDDDSLKMFSADGRVIP